MVRKAGVLAALILLSSGTSADQPPFGEASVAAAGAYIVIGSFARRGNAVRWAQYNDEFGTAVQTLENSGQTVYRVVVGPLENDAAPMMLEILKSVGLPSSWPLALCGGTSAAHGCSGLDDAHSARIAER